MSENSHEFDEIKRYSQARLGELPNDSSASEREESLLASSLAARQAEQLLRHSAAAEKRRKELHDLRKEVLPKLYSLAKWWLGFVVTVIFLQGVKPEFLRYFHWSDPVIIALLTTSTATVLGMFGIAANWLFPKK